MANLLPSAALWGHPLVKTAELLSPRSMMQLPSWSQASHQAVQAAHPTLDLGNGTFAGRKLCVTWKERVQQFHQDDERISALMAGDRLSEAECRRLCESARKILQREPNIVPVQAPVTIVGDIHGQYMDLLNMLSLCGPAPETSYLFLGNYVNRGYDSIATMSLLLLLKVRFPQRITLLRGNHESRQLSQSYGFYDECMRCYGSLGPQVWREFTDCFDTLPLAAVVEGSMFCVHSGLSPLVDNLHDIETMDRMKDVPHEGRVHDMLYSEPDDREGWGFNGRSTTYTFGSDITQQFLHSNGLNLLTRAHCLAMEGYAWMQDEKCLTLWSAPNYCHRCRNRAAVLEVDEHMDFNLMQYFTV